MYSKALVLEPRHVPTLVAYGQKLLSLGRPAMAHRYLAAAVNLQPHHPIAWCERLTQSPTFTGVVIQDN